MEIKKCPQCEKPIGVGLGYFRDNRHQFRLSDVVVVKLPFICECCGGEYIPKHLLLKSKRRNRFCSIACQRETYRKK